MGRLSNLRTAILAGCMAVSLIVNGGPAAAQQVDDIVPHATLKKLGAVHLIVQDIDQSSFKKVISTYPLRNTAGAWRVSAGQYLVWKLVNSFPTRTRVGRMWLHAFRQRCWMRASSIGPIGVYCSIFAQLRVKIGRRVHVMNYRHKNMNVGAHFDPHSPDYRAAVRAEVRMPIDRAIASFVEQMRRRRIRPEE